MLRCTLPLFVLLLGVVTLVGCAPKTTGSSSDDLDPQRSVKYILKSEPADPKTPTEVKETVTEPTLLAIAGRIDAGDIEPFQDGIATFVLSQLPDSSHAGGDANHADNCPFCKRKLKNAPKAVVQFVDSGGEVLPIDARKLFGLAKGDVVVVQGTASIWSRSTRFRSTQTESTFAKLSGCDS